MEPKTRSCVSLLSILLVFSLKTQFCVAADTISPGESLSGTQTLSSKGGDFELGFFTPGKSQKYYIGIWFKKVSQQTVVWVANRETPLLDASSQLGLSEDGNLVLLNQSGVPIWSTNSTTITKNSTIAELLDTGNLVLRDGSNSSAVFWQSFDHPTDTWLPGGWIGLNKITGEKNQLLISWRNSEDPAPGPFSLEIDPSGNNDQYIIRRDRRQQYWRSGPWNGQIFSEVPEMRSSYIYNFSFDRTRQGNYFTYSVYNSTIITRFFIDITGQIKQNTWIGSPQQWNLFWTKPVDQCDVYSLCGAYGYCNDQGVLAICNCLEGFQPRSIREWNLSDWSGGCERKMPLNCGNTSFLTQKKDEFVLMPDIRLPDSLESLSVQSREACELACLNNCSCIAYSFGTGSCSLRSGDLLNLKLSASDSTGANDLYIRLAASEVNRSDGKGLEVWVIVGPILGFIALLGIVLMVFWRSCRTRRVIGAPTTGPGSLVAFSYRDLQTVTKNFSEKLGGGGFGSVFKGTLPDSSYIAVKKLEGISQGEKQFRTEVSTIGAVHHVNLIRLRGFCSEGAQRLLVYDHMPNGSLDSHLFRDSSKNSQRLDWQIRYQIALGTARGLAYLHEKCRDCIIHCDVKPENILLDDGFSPKVADFGLAKLVGRDFSRVLTTMRGTRGYLAPEWISGLAITVKADVYSYGMMLFEIISGRRNNEQQSEDNGKIGYFPTWAAKRVNEGQILGLLDYRLAGEANFQELNRACRVACWCIQDDEDHRPSMGQVVQILEGILEVNMPPIPRSLQILVGNPESSISLTESSFGQGSQPQSDFSTDSQAKSSSSTSSMV